MAGSAATADVCASEDPAALGRIGTAALEHHRFGEALEAFTRAAALDPGAASHCFGAGVAAFMLGHDAVAQARFECALSIDPAYVPAAVWLGDLHYRAGRLDEAISVYETAQRHSGDGRQLQEQLVFWRKEHALQRRFHEMRTAHFSVLFDPAVGESFAREVLARLEAAYHGIGSTLGVFPSRPIGVVLYTRDQFGEITKLAAWSVAAYDGRIRIPVTDGLMQRAELERVLWHEYVHAVVARVGGRTVPAWLSEGLATVLEPAGSEDSDATPPQPDLRPALATLHRGFVGLSRRDAEVAYASASLAVRRLIERNGAAAVVQLLEDLGRGVPFAAAFEQRFAMRYEVFAESAQRD